MACPVMTRRVLKNLLLIIPVASEFPQRRQSLFAFSGIKPAFGQDQLGGVDSVFYLGERNVDGLPAGFGERFRNQEAPSHRSTPIPAVSSDCKRTCGTR